MAKEIFLYGGIDDLSAEFFMNKISGADNEDILVYINSKGGDPQSSFGMIKKFQEHSGNKNIEVHGKAQSAAAFFLLYADHVKALDVSEFLFHRAAYPSFIESDSNIFTDEMKKSLSIVNDSLKEAFVSKIDVEKFEKITGVTVEDLFSMDTRINVVLTASEAKQIGLVDEIYNITPEKRAEINSRTLQMAASKFDDVKDEKPLNIEKQKTGNKKSRIMTINEFKNEHPEIYAKAVDFGVKKERDRIGAAMVYVDIDAKMVTEIIASGETITATQQAELTRKSITKEALVDLEKESPKSINTETPENKEATIEEKEFVSFKDELEALKTENIN